MGETIPALKYVPTPAYEISSSATITTELRLLAYLVIKQLIIDILSQKSEEFDNVGILSINTRINCRIVVEEARTTHLRVIFISSPIKAQDKSARLWGISSNRLSHEEKGRENNKKGKEEEESELEAGKPPVVFITRRERIFGQDKKTGH